jgi:hypothetical protein
MKKIISGIFFLITVNLVYAQWPKVYGHNSYDAIGRAICNSNDGGVIFTGAERLISSGDLIGYLRKTDINGNELWKRYFSQGNNVTVNLLGVSINESDEILVSGAIMSSYNIEICNGFVLKLNQCGEKIWCKIFDIPGQNLCWNNILLSDNGYIIHTNNNQYNYDRIWLYRLDSEGTLLWQKCMEPDTNYFDETGYNLLLTNDSCVLVTGFDYFIREPGSGLGWFSPLWVKFDLEGNQLWDLSWYGDGFISGDFGHTIQDAWGNYYGAGSDGFQEVGMHACFFKFSSSGVPISNPYVFDNGIGSVTKSITFFADSTLFLGGSYSVTTSTANSMVIKADTAGNQIKTKNVPLYGFPVAYSVLTTDNKVVALGERYVEGLGHWETCLFKFNQELEYDSTYTLPRVYDSLCPHPVTPVETITLDCIIVDTEEPVKQPENSLLKIYPVPSSDKVTISLPEYYVIEDNSHHIKTTTTYYQLTGDKTIEVYDLNGRKTATYPLPDGQTSISLDVSNWSPGIYLARLVCKGKVWTQGKMMVGR